MEKSSLFKNFENDSVKVVKTDNGYDISISQGGDSDLEKFLRIDGRKTKNYTLVRKDDGGVPRIKWFPKLQFLEIVFDPKDTNRDISQPCDIAYQFKRQMRCYYYDHDRKLHSPNDSTPSLIHNYAFGYWKEQFHNHGELINESGENDVVGYYQHDYSED